MCDLHPDIHCFHHRITDHHFELTRPRLLVWAQSIKLGKAAIDRCPNVEPFKANHALKRASPSASKTQPVEATGTPAATAPVPAPATAPLPAPAPAPYPPYSGYPYPAFNPNPPMPFAPYAPPFPQMPIGNPFSAYMPWYPNPMQVPPSNPMQPLYSQTPGPVRMDASVDPPSSPIRGDFDVAEFCQLYNLDDDTQASLELLGFVIGDDLEEVTEKEDTAAGFKALAWKRVLKAYKKFKRDNKS